MNIEIIFDIVLIIIGLYLALFKSYFQEKGKNIATSEDIGRLTLEVESVKQQFIEKNANLKAKLDLITNLQLNHKIDERVALIDFHKKLKNWIALLTEPSPSLINDHDNEEIGIKLFSYDGAYQEVLSAEALIELYVDDEKLAKLIQNIKFNSILNLMEHPRKFLIDLKQNNLELEEQKKMIVDTIGNIDKRSEKHAELLKKRKQIIDNYSKNMIKGLKQNLPFEREYSEYIKNYVAKISHDQPE